jgi:hypothetical protein
VLLLKLLKANAKQLSVVVGSLLKQSGTSPRG